MNIIFMNKKILYTLIYIYIIIIIIIIYIFIYIYISCIDRLDINKKHHPTSSDTTFVSKRHHGGGILTLSIDAPQNRSQRSQIPLVASNLAGNIHGNP